MELHRSRGLATSVRSPRARPGAPLAPRLRAGCSSSRAPLGLIYFSRRKLNFPSRTTHSKISVDRVHSI